MLTNDFELREHLNAPPEISKKNITMKLFNLLTEKSLRPKNTFMSNVQNGRK